MDKVKRLKELTAILSKASYAYYGLDNPIMSDKKYDDLYDELISLEKETDTILAGSPTQKVQGYVLDGFKMVEHSKPMLSANKTKDVEEIKKFVGKNDFYGSYKLDGLTLVVRYENGKFVQGITRGNGNVGEDVTEQCKFISNLPMTIQNKNPMELRGECVISWNEFNRINSQLETQYSHPRNLAAGTLRNLDLNIVKSRRLSFVVFEIVTPTFIFKPDGLEYLDNIGFETVRRYVRKNTDVEVEDCVEVLQPKYYDYPTDGLVFELCNAEISKQLGSTSHHECCRMALKWEDDLYETRLRNIEWQTSKTGLINPVAVFEPVDLDGAITTRATLHNISYIEDLQLGIGDTIRVFRANMVIPKVHDSITKSNNIEIPIECPCCGSKAEIHNENGSKTLHCVNIDCPAQILHKLVHAVSKNALNVDGMSEATLEFLIDKGWISSIEDIYYLSQYKEEWSDCDGFGKKSVDKMLENIEKSRYTTLDRFLYSLSISLIGRTASKDISKYCNGDFNNFVQLMTEKSYELVQNIDGFGAIMLDSLNTWWNKNCLELLELATEFKFESNTNNSSVTQNMLQNKIFVITGKLETFSNRDELVTKIESLGGKVSGSVSDKTNYLINNDVNSTSGKNKKALELNIPIISEQDFLNMIG